MLSESVRAAGEARSKDKETAGEACRVAQPRGRRPARSTTQNGGALQLSGPRPKAGTVDAWVDDTSHTVRCMREALQLSEPARLHGVRGFLYTGHPIVFSVLFLCCRRNGRLASVALREADP